MCLPLGCTGGVINALYHCRHGALDRQYECDRTEQDVREGVCGLYCRHVRRERLKQQQLYAAIAADKLYSDVAPADDDYAPTASAVSTAYIKTADRVRRPPATDYTHVWQLPLPQQPHDDVITSGCVTSSGGAGGGSIDSRYYVLDHNHQTSSIIPTNDDIQ